MNTKLEKVIILGSSGFIGSALCRLLSKKFPQIQLLGFSSSEVDLLDLSSAMLLKEHFNLTSAVIVCSCIKRHLGDNIDTFNKNVKMIANLCKVLEVSSVERLLYLSSIAVYGEEQENYHINEMTYPFTNTYYGAAKYASERILDMMFKKMKNSKLLVLRPSVIYGQGDLNDTYGPVGFLRQALNNLPIVLWGDGAEKRDFLFIDDLADIIIQLVFSQTQGIFSAVSGVSHSFLEVVEEVSAIYSKALKIRHKERSKKKVDHGFDNTRLLSVIGKYPFTSLKKGVRLTYEWELQKKKKCYAVM